MNFLSVVNDSGGTVFVSPGEYTFDGSITVPHRINLIAFDGYQYRGSATIATEKLESVIFKGTVTLNDFILTLGTDGPVWSSYTEQNSLIQGITFDGTAMTSIATTDGGLIYITDVIGVKINDCHFYKSPGHGITLNHCITPGIEGGSVLLNDSIGIRLQGASGDGFISQVQIGLNDVGIDAVSGYLMRITNNKIFNNSVAGIRIASAPQNYVIIGNDIHDHETGRGLSLKNAFNFVVTGNTISKGDTLLYGDNIDFSTISNNVFEDGAYGILDESSVSFGNAITGNVFYDIDSTRGIYELYSNKNTIAGNIGEDTRTDNYITTYNTADSTLALTQNTWARIALDTCNNRTDSLKFQGDSLVVLSSGLYEIIGNFVVVSDTMTTIEIAPFLEDSIRSAFTSSVTFPDSVSMTITTIGYEYIADTADVDFWIRNTTNDSDVTIKKATTSLKQMAIREPNYTFGAELVTNGTFDSDLTGWLNVDWGTFAQSSGTLHLTYDGTPPAYQSGGIVDASRFSVVDGTTYQFKFDVTKNSGSSKLEVSWRYSLQGSIARDWGDFDSGEYSLKWKSNYTGSISITFDDNAAGDWSIDNVSVREITNP
jgi:hypothetical protein